MVDVSVIHPAAVTYIDHAQRPLGAAAFREREKETKYATLIAEEKAEFVPFVMESTGALGRQAKQFLEKLVISLNLTREFTAAWEIKDYLSRGLAITLQRGNAAVMLQGQQRANSAVVSKGRPRFGAAARRLSLAALGAPDGE